MFFSGFADEASGSLARQIEVTRQLGWKCIEARSINGKLLGTMDDAEFAAVEEQLAGSGVSINCYGSAVANWTRHPRKEEDFEASRSELLRALPRMRRLGVKMLRGMSFLTPADEAPDSPELEGIIFRKVKELVAICADNGVVYGHENCMNYGGLSYVHTLRMLEAVNSPALKLIFDTGNPCFNYRHIGAAPYPLQSSWEFYRQVRSEIVYVHIKDAVALPREDGVRPTPVFTWAGEGCGDVRAIVKDLLATGYDGGFSMEPHLGIVFHEQDAGVLEEKRCAIYLEYARRFMQLMRECGWSLPEA